MNGVELLLLAAPIVVIVSAAWGFKKLWPNTPEPSSPATTLGGARQLTTGQIARGVFWGLWLFVLSQAVLGAIIAFVMLVVAGAAVGSLT